jgi:hypothetical protein
MAPPLRTLLSRRKPLPPSKVQRLFSEADRVGKPGAKSSPDQLEIDYDFAAMRADIAELQNWVTSHQSTNCEPNQ